MDVEQVTFASSKRAIQSSVDVSPRTRLHKFPSATFRIFNGLSNMFVGMIGHKEMISRTCQGVACQLALYPRMNKTSKALM